MKYRSADKKYRFLVFTITFKKTYNIFKFLCYNIYALVQIKSKRRERTYYGRIY